MTGSLMTAKEAQALAWSIHSSAANDAREAGACFRCCQEMGHAATDHFGIDRRTVSTYELHTECLRRISHGNTAKTIR